MRKEQGVARRFYTCVQLLFLILISLFLPRVFLFRSKRDFEKHKEQILHDGLYVVDSATRLQAENKQPLYCCKCCASKKDTV